MSVPGHYSSALSMWPSNASSLVFPPALQEKVDDRKVLVAWTPDEKVNSCSSNFLKCRTNALFQMPFCIVYPVAGVSWLAALPLSECCGQQTEMFTKANRGSFLVLTDLGVLKYTPEISWAPLCCSCLPCCIVSWPESIVEFMWSDFDGAPDDIQSIRLDPGCGFNSNSGFYCLTLLIGACFIYPCASIWYAVFGTGGSCGFEDTNVKIHFHKPGEDKNEATLMAIAYGPDLRARDIRDTIKKLAIFDQKESLFRPPTLTKQHLID